MNFKTLQGESIEIEFDFNKDKKDVELRRPITLDDSE